MVVQEARERRAAVIKRVDRVVMAGWRIWEQPKMAADKDKWGDEGGLGRGVLGLEGARTG